MDTTTWVAIAERAQNSLGLLRQADFDDLGVSRQQVRGLLHGGRLRSVRRGHYAIAGGVPPVEQAIEAARRAAGRSGVISHETAAWLHGWDRVLPDPVHVTIDHSNMTRLAGADIHITTIWPADIIEVRGIRCTTLGRTACDLVTQLHWTQLARFIDFSLAANPRILDQIGSAIGRLYGRGRPCFETLQALIDERTPGNGSVGPLAVRIVSEMVQRGVRPPDEVEYEVIVDGVPRRIDAVWLPERIGLEVKGWLWHGQRTQFDVDIDREAGLTAAGWAIIPAGSRSDLDKLASRLRATISTRYGHSTMPQAR